jgi:hypothetical protein
MSTNPATHNVIPAKAGIHPLPPLAQGSWTPACAGVTRCMS